MAVYAEKPAVFTSIIYDDLCSWSPANNDLARGRDRRDTFVSNQVAEVMPDPWWHILLKIEEFKRGYLVLWPVSCNCTTA